MLRASLTSIICALLLGGSAAAQEPAGTGQRTGGKPPADQTVKPSAEQTSPREAAGQPLNVKLELTITDQTGSGEPTRKTVTMIVADRFQGSIRSTANNTRATLNVDATPQILPNGNVRVQLAMEYNPRQGNSAVQTAKSPNGETFQVPAIEGGSSLNQRIVSVIEPGKPLLLSQAADPISDRKVTVEVRMTILR